MNMIRLEHISIGYAHKVLVKDVDLQISKGRLVALVGRNGAGKSSLLRVLAGLDKPLAGDVYISGKNINNIGASERAKLLSFVTTGRVRIPDLSCRQIVAMGRAPYTDWFGRMSITDSQTVEKCLDSVGMLSFADRPIDTLSDGEGQRVMIARALAQETPVMLLDEPTSFLDMPGRYEICRLLKHLAYESDKTVVFSTHELDIAMNLCDEIILIDSPDIIHGTPQSETISQALSRLFKSAGAHYDSRQCRVVIDV